jgi:nucleoside-diphosphate-sugar epimerase
MDSAFPIGRSRQQAVGYGRSVIEEDLDHIIRANLPWDRLDGATVVVTGANGFLPAYMVETLLRLGNIEVVAMVRSPAKARARFAACAISSLRIVEQDMAHPIDWGGPADFVIHAASPASPKLFGNDPVGTILPNVSGTANALDLARRRNARGFLFFSSAEVYGSSPAQNIDEAAFGAIDPTNPRACYAEAKRLGETLCVAYARQYGLNTVMVRPFHTYGPGLALDDGRVFADFVRDVVERRSIVINGAGTAERAFCYLADATEAFFTALLKGEAATAYNVGNPAGAISIKALACLLAETFPDRVPSVEFQAPTAGTYMPSPIGRTLPDINRLSALGWCPATGIAEGFSRTIRATLSEVA